MRSFVSIVLFLFFAACSESDPIPAELKDWTVFIYGHADHNLSSDFMRDLWEMNHAELEDNVAMIVAVDLNAGLIDERTMEPFPSGTAWLRIRGGGMDPEVLTTLPEQNFDDPALLSEAIASAFAEYPARRYGLILWDHGGAWMHGFGGDTQNGTVDGPGLSIKSLRTAITDGLKDLAKEGGPPLDFLSFDTCLLAGAEALSEFQALARLYIANAEIDYGRGWDYEPSLSFLSQFPNASLEEFAEAQNAHWEAHHLSIDNLDDVLLRSHVSIDLTALAPFTTAMRSLSEALTGSMNDLAPVIARKSFFVRPNYDHSISESSFSNSLRDVGRFLSTLTTMNDAPSVKESAESALEALENMTWALSQGTLRSGAGHTGVHIELAPPVKLTAEYVDDYAEKASAFVAATGWDEVLRALGAKNDATPPLPTITTQNATDPDLENLPAVRVSSSDADIAEAQTRLAVHDLEHPEKLVVFQTLGGVSLLPEQSVDISWDGQLIAITDGQGGMQPVTAIMWEDATQDDGLIRSPEIYGIYGKLLLDDDELMEGALLLFAGETEIHAAVLMDGDQPFAIGAKDIAEEFRGAQFVPTLLVLENGTETRVEGTPFDWPADGVVSVSRTAAPAGTYRLITTLFDIWGNHVHHISGLIELLSPLE